MKRSMTFTGLRVTDVHDVTPHMRRITFDGDGLAALPHVAPDQQVKLFFARDGGVPEVPAPEQDGDVARWYRRYMSIPEPVRPWMRTYSIRRHLPELGQVEIDFAMHGEDDSAGPATQWAVRARPGDVIAMLGPSPSQFRAPIEGAWKLLVGDETALPAIGALLEAMEPGERALVLAEVAGPQEEQKLQSAAEFEVRWLHRGATPPGRAALLPEAVRAAELPPGPVFAWVAGEASAVRAVRRHLVEERGLAKSAVAFCGYWRLHLTQDDAPTPEETAEKAEEMAEAGIVPIR
ncbi:siderophore-interacting protein [Spongiactinospora sp. 9N601]|uniref:siderophore-interacting protein n=1 Tax=Spongiactinospora sp. 9N601 TaxID=3375149 RepID=UPI0037894F11